jgi:hypothetical protein
VLKLAFLYFSTLEAWIDIMGTVFQLTIIMLIGR